MIELATKHGKKYMKNLTEMVEDNTVNAFVFITEVKYWSIFHF